MSQENCSRSDSYFGTTDFTLHSSIVASFIALPLYYYGAFCIISLTPKIMESAKTPLLIMHFWNIFLDVFMNFMSIPYAFFPTYSMILLGVGSRIRIPTAIQVICFQCSIGCQTTAILSLFENRHSQLETKWKIERKSTRILVNACNYFIAVILVPFQFIKQVDDNQLRVILLKEIPCVVAEFFQPGLFIVTDQAEIVSILTAASMVIFVSQGAFHTLHTIYSLVFLTLPNVSQSTRRLQIRLFFATCIQVAIPVFAMAVPIMYIIYSMYARYYNQAYNNLTMAVISIHGVLSIICMILVHKPYRAHFFKTVFNKTAMTTPVGLSQVTFVSRARAVRDV